MSDKKQPHDDGGNEDSDDGCLLTENPPASASDPTTATRMVKWRTCFLSYKWALSTLF